MPGLWGRIVKNVLAPAPDPRGLPDAADSSADGLLARVRGSLAELAELRTHIGEGNPALADVAREEAALRGVEQRLRAQLEELRTRELLAEARLRAAEAQVRAGEA